MAFLLYAVAVVLFLLYKLATAKKDYFEKKGIPFAKPMLIVGSRADLILRNKTVLEVVKGLYDEFRDAK